MIAILLIILPLFFLIPGVLRGSIYGLKWLVAFIAIRIYNGTHRRRFDLYDVSAQGDPLKLGYVPPPLEKELETPFPEIYVEKNRDEVVFFGVNTKVECFLVRIARDCNQLADAWIYLKLANGKSYHLSETAGYQQHFVEKSKTFSCGPLQMHYLAPMRRWRIFFCGMLEEISENKEESKSVFVKFIFLWKASSDVYDLTLSTNPKGIASAVARSNWRSAVVPPVNSFVETMDVYAQSGVITGTVSVSDGPEYEMYFLGEKTRNIGNRSSAIPSNFINFLGNIPQNGFNFHLEKATVPYIFKDLPFGFAVHPDGSLEAVKEVDISIDTTGTNVSRNNFKASFAAGEKYDIIGNTLGEPIVFHSDKGLCDRFELRYVEFEVDDKKGIGAIMKTETSQKRNTPVKQIRKISIPDVVPLTLKLTDSYSHFEEITGGKGSSLGRLTQLSKKETTFVVPKGIVVTIAAYQEFLTPEIINAVKNLEKVAYGKAEGNLQEVCKTVTNIVADSILPKRICDDITENLRNVFEEDINQIRFAVRSSATGEDSAAMSAAGQMDTYLGVQSLIKIFEAVKKCWASQFSNIAVQYKRRNGQILNSPMAVVIQEMVACDVSGVLFTCDPVTNNPAFITITANYGLGESVVSGTVEPDTISLRRKMDELEIDSVIIGTKQQRIVMQDTGGTITEEISEDSRKNPCLSKETAERLGYLSIKIEKYYKSSRDIEWGVLNGSIYILQSRPVTNVANETEFEIKHEFDAPLRCENEYYSIANIGEVMPGATSPLGIDVLLKFFSNAFKKKASDMGLNDNVLQSKYYPSGMLPFYNHMIITVAEIITRYGMDTPMSNGYQISLFGRVLDDPELIAFTKEKIKKTPSQSLRQSLKISYHYYWDLFFSENGMHKVRQTIDSYHRNFTEAKTSEEAFTALLNSCSDFDKSAKYLLTCSEMSSNWNMFMLDILRKAKGCFDNDVYGEFARLLSTSVNIESASIPDDLQKVATQITEDISHEEFKSMSAEEAEKWLQTSKSLSGTIFRQFIEKHGHRCIKEFDMFSITWGMDPKHLIKLLQDLVGSRKNVSSKENEINPESISDFKIPLNFWSKCLLKFVLPNCRRGVAARETSKSLIIKSLDHWRHGYRHLSKLMVSEGRIPEEDLLFFLTIDEIEELLNTRSPSLISRANYRKKMYPILEGYKFPEIMKGAPKPINDCEESEPSEFVVDLSMTGIPVSQGVVKGYARVAVTLEEASHLKLGEILITHCTDIGWSPYFPVISGVVTELGGLISHGAVVSREYGLPCVAGLQGATRKFHTGDFVLLDGKKGILQRLPKP